MAFCAGYVSPSKLNVRALAAFAERVETGYACSRGERRPISRIIETKHGHHVLISFADACSQPFLSQDDEGNSLIVSGFVRPTDASSIFDRAVHQSPATLEALEGQFVALFCDAASGAIHIINDRFASRPFYFLRAGEDTFYASSLKWLFLLAGIRPSADPLGWLEIFCYSHTLGQRTNRSGALRLRPASHVTISPRGLDDRQYWKLSHQPEELNIDAHADATFEAFQESCAWRIRRFPKCLIALSGGLDSRLVAGSRPGDVEAVALTLATSVNGEPDREVHTAAQIAARLGLPHEVCRIAVGSYSRIVDDVIDLTEGLVPMHHPAKTMHFVHRLATSGGYLVGGGPGDVLAGSYIPSAKYVERLPVEAFGSGYWAHRQKAACLPLVFSREFLGDYARLARDSFLESWSSLSGPTAAHRATAWGMVVRQPAFTFSSPLHNHPYFEEGTPHLGYRYSDLMLRLPADLLYKRVFYKYMIYRQLPELRDVVYANTGELISGRLEHAALPTWKAYRDRMATQVKRSLSWARPVKYALYGRPRPTFDFSILSGDVKLIQQVSDLLDHPNFPAFLDRNLCRRFIDRFRGGVQAAPDLEAHVFGCLASVCFSAKQGTLVTAHESAYA